jgi:hypothetical protein
MTPLVCEAVKLAPQPETAMWFDIGHLARDDRVVLSSEEVLYLPYKRTGVVGFDTKGGKFSLWFTGGENSVTVAGCSMEAPVRYFAPFAWIKTDDGIRYYNNDKEVTKEELEKPLRLAFTVVGKIQSLSQGYRPTPKRTFLNQKRIAKGKPPLAFDWHTVAIEPPAKKNESQGGTHSSPRLHDRRGHYRLIKKTNKRVWVKSCKVGSAKLGVIFKDYTIKDNIDSQVNSKLMGHDY